VVVTPEAPAIAGSGLEHLVNEYRTVVATINRLSRLYAETVLWEMVYGLSLSLEQMKDESTVKAFCDQLSDRLLAVAAKGSAYTVVVRKDQERQLYFPVVKLLAHGVESETEYHQEFFSSGEYRSLIALGETLNSLIEEDGYFQRGDKVLQTRIFAEGLEWLMKEARRGYTIQRYKGLGEMNPEQLWETTMDPDVRRMLKVTIEDAIAADQIFTTLMGDQVEPRREFIEDNALSVANLDI
jgi:DNA gyrase subunit B